jgi:uncharacterized protein (DUF952 family)
MAIIYHVTQKKAWQNALTNGAYTAPSLVDEGFIHCSQVQQVAGVLERYFANQTHLVKLVIDTDKLESELLYEFAESVSDTFPHIYGPINLDAVVAVEDI